MDQGNTKATGKKGKEIFLSLRLVIIGMESGPEMSVLLPLISQDQIIKRLTL